MRQPGNYADLWLVNDRIAGSFTAELSDNLIAIEGETRLVVDAERVGAGGQNLSIQLETRTVPVEGEDEPEWESVGTALTPTTGKIVASIGVPADRLKGRVRLVGTNETTDVWDVSALLVVARKAAAAGEAVAAVQAGSATGEINSVTPAFSATVDEGDAEAVGTGIEVAGFVGDFLVYYDQRFDADVEAGGLEFRTRLQHSDDDGDTDPYTDVDTQVDHVTNNDSDYVSSDYVESGSTKAWVRVRMARTHTGTGTIRTIASIVSSGS